MITLIKGTSYYLYFNVTTYKHFNDLDSGTERPRSEVCERLKQGEIFRGVISRFEGRTA